MGMIGDAVSSVGKGFSSALGGMGSMANMATGGMLGPMMGGMGGGFLGGGGLGALLGGGRGMGPMMGGMGGMGGMPQQNPYGAWGRGAGAYPQGVQPMGGGYQGYQQSLYNPPRNFFGGMPGGGFLGSQMPQQMQQHFAQQPQQQPQRATPGGFTGFGQRPAGPEPR